MRPGEVLDCRIWIGGYIKGPDSAPLKVSRKVYELNR